MNRIFLSFLFTFLLSLSGFAQKVYTAQAEILQAVVYPAGADLKVRSTHEVEPGLATIVITNQTEFVQASTLRVEGKGNFTILSAQFKENYLRTAASDSVQYLEKKFNAISLELSVLHDKISSYNLEYSLLEKNLEIKGSQAVLTAVELEKVANFYRKRAFEIKSEIRTLSNKSKTLEDEKKAVAIELSKYNAQKVKKSGEIHVAIQSHAKQTIELTSSYFTPSASWSPLYDIRMNGTNQPLAYEFKASVQQTTRVDWKNVKVTLSTAQPNKSSNAPYINPWVLRKYEEPKVYARTNKFMVADDAAPMQAELSFEEEEPILYASSLAVSKQEKQTFEEYAIQQPVTILAAETKALLSIANYSIPTSYVYYAVPKKSSDVYLQAYITNFEQYNLLSASANLFIENTFVGTSYFAANATQDSMLVSFGVDNNIQIDRKRVYDMESKKILSKKNKQSHSYIISVRNNKSSAITLHILDQIPLSTNKEISVINVTHPKAEVDNYGKVLWKETIPSRTTQTYTLSFDIEYPRDWHIEGL